MKYLSWKNLIPFYDYTIDDTIENSDFTAISGFIIWVLGALFVGFAALIFVAFNVSVFQIRFMIVLLIFIYVLNYNIRKEIITKKENK